MSVSEVGRWGWWEYFIREEVENEWGRGKKKGERRERIRRGLGWVTLGQESIDGLG